MENETKLPERKHPRLDRFDYSTAGAYFITVCTQNRRCVLSRIVGRGLAPAEWGDPNAVERDLAPAVVLTSIGEIAKEQLFQLEKRYPFLAVDQYVIMPNHIHVIFVLKRETAGASPRPTVMDIVCAYKSLTARECKKRGLISEKLFQTSFYDHVIRNKEDYEETVRYIAENPMRWAYDELYREQ